MGLLTRFFGTDFGHGVVAATALCGTTAVAYHVYHQWAEGAKEAPSSSAYEIRTLKQLRAVVPAGKGGSCVADALKVLDHLDAQMLGFIERSPFLHLVCYNVLIMSSVSQCFQ